MNIPKVIFDKYYHYEELKETLYALTEAAPDLCKLKVIGQSWQKRDIIALEITDYKTGVPEEKTGYYHGYTYEELKSLYKNFAGQPDELRMLMDFSSLGRREAKLLLEKIKYDRRKGI